MDNAFLPVIYVFPNSDVTNGDILCCAIAQDGCALASHISSSEWWAKHDMGVSSYVKHDIYLEHYPEGFVIEYVESKDVPTHKGLNEALRLNNANNMPLNYTPDKVEFEPCPFCDEQDKIAYIKFANELGRVVCDSCHASGPPGTTEAEAVRLWNNNTHD